MTPSHHLPAEWVAGYAAGALADAEAVVAATHLVYCPVCRRATADAERVASLALEDASPIPVDPRGLESVLARLDGPTPALPAPAPDALFPAPLRALAGPSASLPRRWRWLAPGVRGVDLPVQTSGLPLRIVQMAPGLHLPHHHAGEEAAVVLQGGWTDATGHYQRGDAAFFEADGAMHDQRIDEGRSCIAVVLNARRARPAGALRRMLGGLAFRI